MYRSSPVNSDQIKEESEMEALTRLADQLRATAREMRELGVDEITIRRVLNGARAIEKVTKR